MDGGRGSVRVGNDNERVDLEVGKVAVDIDGIQAADEVDKNVVNTLGDLAQQGRGNLLIGGVLLQIDGDEELLSLSIDITDVNTTLVGEENPVALEARQSVSGVILTKTAVPVQATIASASQPSDLAETVVGSGSGGRRWTGVKSSKDPPHRDIRSAGVLGSTLPSPHK